MEKQKIIRQLKEIKRIVEMNTCDFGEETQLIKNKTQLWRDTWIIFPLNDIIEEMEKQK